MIAIKIGFVVWSVVAVATLTAYIFDDEKEDDYFD